MEVVGFTEGFHDSSLAIIDGSELVFAAQSERYSRVKNDKILHPQLIEYAKESGATEIAFYEKPNLKKTRQLYTGQYKEAFSERKISLKPNHYFSHHLSHAAAAFQTSPFEKSTVIIVDSVGEWDTVSVWLAWYDKNGKAQYKKKWSQKYPYSLGMFYSSATKCVGLKPNEEEFILMGMSAYGIRDRIGLEIRLKKMIEERNIHIHTDNDKQKFNIAYTTQSILEEELYKIFSKAIQSTGCYDVCYGGGVALNCVANSKIKRLTDRMWIFPNPGDGGSAVGCAALINRKHIDFKNAFLGEDISGEYPVKEIITELDSFGIVGVANGRAEFGPRALGNRSILADPRSIEIKNKLNEIKGRESFRPFGAIVLEEDLKKWFDIEYDSPYMQYVALHKDAYSILGLKHHDSSCRIQTVGQEHTGLREVLEKWRAKTGQGILINTSLNIKGEPLVNDKTDAQNFEKEHTIKVFGY
jgi:carbamoyltransferase